MADKVKQPIVEAPDALAAAHDRIAELERENATLKAVPKLPYKHVAMPINLDAATVAQEMAESGSAVLSGVRQEVIQAVITAILKRLL